MFEIIITTLIISTFLNILLKKLDLPTIIGYIGTGFLIAYLFGLHEVNNNHNLQMIAEFGIVFLMFTIGLEFSFSSFMKMRKAVFLYGGLQFSISSIIFFLICNTIFGLDIINSLIIGLALSLSSTAIVLKLLNENNNINKSYGQKSLGILLFQDLAVIPIMILISILSIENSSILLLVSKTVLGGVLLVTILLLVGKYLLEYILIRVSKTNSNEIFISAILALVLGASYLAHALGLSYSLGALIAGIMIAETHFKHRVESDLIPFRDLLLGVFFITVGMQIDIQIVYEYFPIIISLLVGISILKIGIIYTIIQFFSKKIISIRTSLTLFQVGEFALVIFGLANVNNLLDSKISQILIVTIIISMIITPIVMKNIDNITSLFIKDNFIPENDLGDKKLENHIILIGHGKIGNFISDQLSENGEKYYIIENDIIKFKQAKKQSKPIFFGDASKGRILNILNIEKAKYILITIHDNKNLYQVCDILSHIVPKAKIIIKVNSCEQKKKIESLNLTNVVYETEEVANGMIKAMKKDLI